MAEKNSFHSDIIIYSANLTGVVAALVFKLKGENVLLLNRYGFFGGTITESLNLFQKKIVRNEEAEITKKILDSICIDKDGILQEDDKYFVFNPEVLKFKLQKICEENRVDLLFHITPYKIDFMNDLIRLVVIGREGEINLSCKKLFDFSNEFTFAPLIDKSSRIFRKSFVNFISLPIQVENILSEVYRKIKLRDNRWWISLEHSNLNLFNVEETAQSDFDKFDEMLRKNSSRIQIVPAQSNLVFDFKRTKKIDERITFISDFIDLFNLEDELVVANQIENRLKNESNF